MEYTIHIVLIARTQICIGCSFKFLLKVVRRRVDCERTTDVQITDQLFKITRG
jgi:hypothetical protein